MTGNTEITSELPCCRQYTRNPEMCRAPSRRQSRRGQFHECQSG